MNPEVLLVFRVFGILSFLSLFGVLWRITYYTNSIILKHVTYFLFFATLGRGVCFTLDVYVFPEWENIFSFIYNGTILYYLVFYLFVVGTTFKNSAALQEQQKLKIKSEKLSKDITKFVEVTK